MEYDENDEDDEIIIVDRTPELSDSESESSKGFEVEMSDLT